MPEQELMELMTKYATPGAEHKLLSKHVGRWKLNLKMWMSRGEAPQESQGTANITMLLDGRVRQEELQSEMGGMPFRGIGQLGYDNFTKRYWMSWVDNMSTGIMTAWGTASRDGKDITFNAKVNNPLRNQKDVPQRFVYRILSDDHQIFEMWDQSGTAQEYQALEVHYKRQ